MYLDITDPTVDACVAAGHDLGDDERCLCGYRSLNNEAGDPALLPLDQACAAYGHPEAAEDESGDVYCHCGRIVKSAVPDRTDEEE